jgi:hypothetical protein
MFIYGCYGVKYDDYFPNAEQIIFNNCDENFIHYNLYKYKFPKLEVVVSNLDINKIIEYKINNDNLWIKHVKYLPQEVFTYYINGFELVKPIFKNPKDK